MTRRAPMFNPGEEFNSVNDGKFSIIEDKGWNKVHCEFPSGYKTIVQRQQVLNGMVKDYFKPIYAGVGFLGGKKYRTKKGRTNTTEYNRWKHMILRCYDRSHYSFCRYGAIGVTVCTEWHNFQNYAKWYQENKIDNCDVDKDILSSGQIIYSPETCSFISHQKNSEYAVAKRYTLINPSGSVIAVYNLNKFCRENGLTTSLMRKVITGKRNHHKGWRAAHGNTKPC
ncbi:hypothetical protein VCSRO127_0495 [Vibrio cholerae]|nr:hypothetical protein VCSRO62_0307 [Vibrio cholerae]GHZ69186.1 hypothetical protein VCSRO127_0495 [Vibrio cholerae]